jgi:hypothetical protein
MAQSQIRVPSIEELKAAAQNRQSTFDPAAMTKGFAQGMTLEDTIAQKSLDRQKAEEDLKKEIMAAKMGAQQQQARNTFIDAAKQPLAQPKPISNVQMPQAPVAPIAGQQAAEASLTGDINKALASKREQEAARVSAINKPIELQNAAIAYQPEKFMPQTQKQDMGARYQQSQIQILGPNGVPTTVQVGWDTVTGGLINPMTHKPITDPKELEGMMTRGYAVSQNFVGLSADKQPIVMDNRLGVMTVNGQPYHGAVFPKLQNAPASVVESISNLNTAKFQLNQIQNMFTPDLVGPISGRGISMAGSLGTLGPKSAEFLAQLKTYQNAMIKAITGAQMSEPEAKRLMAQMPSMNDLPEAFLAKLQVAGTNLDASLAAKLDALEKSNYAVAQSLTPAQAEALVISFTEGPKNVRGGQVGTGETKRRTKDGRIAVFSANKQFIRYEE